MRTNESEAISNLQTYLRQLSYFDPDISSVPIDGIFESETKQGIMDFQKKYGLEQTGIADRETWDAIYDAYLDSMKENSPPNMISPFPFSPPNYNLSKGEQWFLVNIIQYMLGELSHSYDGFEKVVISGIYDDETERVIREFQRRNFINVTGSVDKETWNLLSNQFNNIAKNKNE